MPKYRVGERTFDSHQEAEAYRSSLPDPPGVFVEPDEAPADAYTLVTKTGSATGSAAPWIAVGIVLAVHLGLRVVGVQLFLHGRAPPVNSYELLSYFVDLAIVWWAVSVLARPAGHARGTVGCAGILVFLTGLGLVGQIFFAVWIVRRVRSAEAEIASIQGVPQGDSPRLALAPTPRVDGGPPHAPRPWAAYASPDGQYRISFPGTPVAHGSAAHVGAPDGATFDVTWRTTRASTLTAARRAAQDEVAALAQRSDGAVLDQREHVDAVTRLAERAVRIALTSRSRELYARIVVANGRIYVATAVLAASDTDEDALTFLESFTLAR